MKMTRFKNGLSVTLTILSVQLATGAPAEPPTKATASSPDKHYTGTVVLADAKEHTLTVKGWFFSKKTFNLGDNCSYQLWQKPEATADALHPGEKVTVSYQETHGVLIADGVCQQPLQYEGSVKAIDPGKHVLTLRLSTWDKQLRIANDCKVWLHGDQAGTLADLHPGDHVTVVYDQPGDQLIARQISQTSQKYTGTLNAIDLGERTLKVRSFFDAKKFNVANDCSIVINGHINGRMRDLQPGSSVTLSYDEINGVNVANRIAPTTTTGAEAPTNTVASASASAEEH